MFQEFTTFKKNRVMDFINPALSNCMKISSKSDPHFSQCCIGVINIVDLWYIFKVLNFRWLLHNFTQKSAEEVCLKTLPVYKIWWNFTQKRQRCMNTMKKTAMNFRTLSLLYWPLGAKIAITYIFLVYVIQKILISLLWKVFASFLISFFFAYWSH